MWEPNIFSISITDLGPCIWTGDTSISRMSTLNLPDTLTPCAQSRNTQGFHAFIFLPWTSRIVQRLLLPHPTTDVLLADILGLAKVEDVNAGPHLGIWASLLPL